MYFADDELAVASFPTFPADGNGRVCPTNAITWDLDAVAPSVTASDCVGCGLCVVRCPVGAIHVTTELTAKVNDQETGLFSETSDEVSQESTDALAAIVEQCPWEGTPINEDDSVLERLNVKLTTGLAQTGAQGHNHLARNAMLVTGASCAMRRRGDVNIRMDLVAMLSSGQKSVVEVQPSLAAILEAPRDLMDDLAVLSSRYALTLNQIVPMLMTLKLPNKRSEYWQLINDVREVLGVSVRSISLTALLMLAWNRCVLAVDSESILYADSDSYSIRDSVEALLGREINCSIGLAGLFESQK